MKKLFCKAACVVAMMAVVMESSAQESLGKSDYDIVFRNGTKVFSLGAGFMENGSWFSEHESLSMPTISLFSESCWKETERFGAFGYGCFVKYGGFKRKYTETLWLSTDEDGNEVSETQERTASNHWLGFGPLVSYHYTPAARLDLFARAYFGIRLGSLSDYSTDRKKTYVYGVEGGATYMFTSSLGIYASASYDITFLNAGLVLNLTNKRNPKSPTSKW